MEAGLATERFWRLTVPEIHREMRGVNNQREFDAAMAAAIANYAGQSLFEDGDQLTVDRLLGREETGDKKHWAQKAYMYFDMSARTREMENGDG